MTVETLFTCEKCGHVGPDVVQHHEYVGGRGYKWFVECYDWRACQRRRERGAA